MKLADHTHSMGDLVDHANHQAFGPLLIYFPFVRLTRVSQKGQINPLTGRPFMQVSRDQMLTPFMSVYHCVGSFKICSMMSICNLVESTCSDRTSLSLPLSLHHFLSLSVILYIWVCVCSLSVCLSVCVHVSHSSSLCHLCAVFRCLHMESERQQTD